MIQAVLFAIIAAISFGLYSTFQDLGSKNISTLLGAMIISLTALILGFLFFLFKVMPINIHPSPKSIIFLVLAGLFAFGIDIFALKAYGSGLPISIGGPIIIGGSIVVASIVGLILGETLSLSKIAGILLVVIGVCILSSLVK